MKYTDTSRWSKFLVVAVSILVMPSCSWFSTSTAPEAGSFANDKAAASQVITITSKADFDSYIQTKANMVADFHAQWCPPCKRMKPINKALAAEYADVTFVEIDIDQVGELATEYGVRGVPTFIFFKNGTSVEQSVGAMSKEAYKGKLKTHFGV